MDNFFNLEADECLKKLGSSQEGLSESEASQRLLKNGENVIAEGKKSWQEMIQKFYGKFHAEVDQALESQPVKSSQIHQLGNDPVSGKPVFVKIGRFGPVAQIGTGEDGDKPRFASLKNDSARQLEKEHFEPRKNMSDLF